LEGGGAVFEKFSGREKTERRKKLTITALMFPTDMEAMGATKKYLYIAGAGGLFRIPNDKIISALR